MSQGGDLFCFVDEAEYTTFVQAIDEDQFAGECILLRTCSSHSLLSAVYTKLNRYDASVDAYAPNHSLSITVATDFWSDSLDL